MNYIEEDSDLASAYTTAYYSSGLLHDSRINILTEDKSGCCKCFKRNIKNNDISINEYVYCDKCQLAYHLKCVGLKVLPDKDMSFICDKCKKIVL